MTASSTAKSVSTWIRSHWAVIRKTGTLPFVALVVSLLVIVAREIDWAAVWSAILAYRAETLWTAALIALASYLVYSTFDVLGKWYIGQELAWWKSMLVGFISYAFTMSLGAPVGGLGMRLRLYTKMGLGRGEVMRIMGLSLTTNWVGYCLLAGAVFASGQIEMPLSWELGNTGLRLIGVGMLGLGALYLYLCAFSRTRVWTIRGHEIELPDVALAAMQVSLAIVNWCLIAAVIYSVMPDNIAYIPVLGTLLVSAIAGAIAHIPGGIGVTESVFVTFFSSSMPRTDILGAMFVYRAMYYLGPLVLAGVCYLLLETRLATAPSTET